MKKYLLFVFILTVAILTGCQKDYAIPEVSAPDAESVQESNSVDLTFSFTADAGYKSASLDATGGNATIKTNATAGALSGNLVVTFTAGTQPGAGSVTLNLTDKENQISSATAVLTIVEEQMEFTITGNITANTTWETGKVYILASRITVVSGVTLTIQPGVVVKGQAGTGPNATALMIARGGKLEAIGTATSPIIFTSVADEIMPGQIVSPNLDPTLNGLWGGVLILGKAPISADAESMQIEGIPPSDLNGLYGGTLPADNSGTIKYISIRHGGTNIGEGNEINGLTLGGVGSGTVIENVEIIANQDDGIEWFGGTVNVKNAVIWNVGDDAVDTDMAWAGTLDNFAVITPGDECFELDGPEGTASAGHIIKNGSAKAGNAEGLVDLDDNSIVTLTDIYFFGIKTGQDFDDLPSGGGLTASGLQVTLPAGSALTDFFKEGTAAFATVVATGANTVGVNIAPFDGWSWAEVSGALDEF
jgi:hypothetical protein